MDEQVKTALDELQIRVETGFFLSTANDGITRLFGKADEDPFDLIGLTSMAMRQLRSTTACGNIPLNDKFADLPAEFQDFDALLGALARGGKGEAWAMILGRRDRQNRLQFTTYYDGCTTFVMGMLATIVTDTCEKTFRFAREGDAWKSRRADFSETVKEFVPEHDEMSVAGRSGFLAMASHMLDRISATSE